MDKTLEVFQQPVYGEIIVPGDKSMSHRAVIFGALSKGKTHITNLLTGEDCLRTVKAFQALGVSIDVNDTSCEIDSQGPTSFKEPTEPIYFGNSGTTARLLIGLFSSIPGHYVVYGDYSLSKRPMDRVVSPLKQMGASINGRSNGSKLPIAIEGKQLKGMTYELPVHSAQVKTAILLAGMFSDGTTTVIEPVPTRDHTERMLPAFGGKIDIKDNQISITNQQSLMGTNVTIPGDISSAAFFIVASAIIPGSDITIRDVGLNPTRTGVIDILLQMGADITVTPTRNIGEEPVGDIRVKGSPLKGTVIQGDIIPRLIDEIPILALAASQAEGPTIIKDAKELRYKETDRIEAVATTLRKLGVNVTTFDDGISIEGTSKLRGGEFETYSDHRIGMMVAIASLLTSEPVTLKEVEMIDISYPNFFEHLEQLKRKEKHK
ncbi:3-phosphoshikimate 1-carboxyvinyltransferase [Bacillaceae bacterium S4-13-56]